MDGVYLDSCAQVVGLQLAQEQTMACADRRNVQLSERDSHRVLSLRCEGPLGLQMPEEGHGQSIWCGGERRWWQALQQRRRRRSRLPAILAGECVGGYAQITFRALREDSRHLHSARQVWQGKAHCLHNLPDARRSDGVYQKSEAHH